MKFYDKQGFQLRAPAIAKFLTSVISYRQVRFRKAFAIAAASREANVPQCVGTALWRRRDHYLKV